MLGGTDDTTDHAGAHVALLVWVHVRHFVVSCLGLCGAKRIAGVRGVDGWIGKEDSNKEFNIGKKVGIKL